MLNYTDEVRLSLIIRLTVEEIHSRSFKNIIIIRLVVTSFYLRMKTNRSHQALILKFFLPIKLILSVTKPQRLKISPLRPKLHPLK